MAFPGGRVPGTFGAGGGGANSSGDLTDEQKQMKAMQQVNKNSHGVFYPNIFSFACLYRS